jgi:hypothetical protein
VACLPAEASRADLTIKGNKKDNVTIIYTPWSNLKKDGSMAVGQVGFKDQKKVHPLAPILSFLHVETYANVPPRIQLTV